MAYPITHQDEGDFVDLPADRTVYFELTQRLEKGGEAQAKIRIYDAATDTMPTQDVFITVRDFLGYFEGQPGDYGRGDRIFESVAKALVSVIQLPC